MPAKLKSKTKKNAGAMMPPLASTPKQKRNQKAAVRNAAIAGVLYTMVRDKTLTQAQALGFRADIVSDITARRSVKKGAFRFPSNPTLHGLSSGYHEAFVVTDMSDVLARRTKATGGISSMPAASRGYWKQHSGVKIHEAHVAPMLEAGDGARTDTARTILSGPKGAVAGHSGSGVSTSGQQAAHDLLRDQSMRVIRAPKLSPQAIGVVAAATAVFSMAPGQLASTASGAASIKDKAARDTWEADRNQAKARLAVAHAQLPADQQQLVMQHMQPLVTAIGGGRKLEPARPMSPRRKPRSSPSAPIQGGGYDASAPHHEAPTATLPANASPGLVAAYVTAPLRIPRK